MNEAKFWNGIATKYYKSPIGDVKAYEETRDRMIELFAPDMSVLEIGCGTGSTAVELAPHVASYHGTDLASAMIELAQARPETAGLPNLRFSTADAGTIEGGPYDAVLGLNLLHLLPELERDLEAVAGATKSGGLFLSKTVLMGEAKWYLRAAIPVMQLLKRAPFVRYITQRDTIEAIENAGFAIEETFVQTGMVDRIFIVARKK